MNIPFPCEEQIKNASRIICEKTLPKHETVFSFIKNMTRQMGVGKLFVGTADAVIVALAAFLLIGIAVPSKIYRIPDAQWMFSIFLFAFSPVFFALYFALSLWKEHDGAVYQIKMTCKYTIYHLLAYRMFILSLVSFVINGLYVAMLCYRLDLSMVQMLCITFSSLLIFSLLLIVVLLRYDSLFSLSCLYLLWGGGNAVGALLCPRQLASVLCTIPVGLWIVMDCILVAALYSRFSAYINGRVYRVNSQSCNKTL